MKTSLAVVIGLWTLGTAITIDTKLGRIEGVSTSNSIHQFLNIPYAEPPGTPQHVSSFKMMSFDFLLITTTVSTQLMICDGNHQNHWQPLNGIQGKMSEMSNRHSRMMVQNGATRAFSLRQRL